MKLLQFVALAAFTLAGASANAAVASNETADKAPVPAIETNRSAQASPSVRPSLPDKSSAAVASRARTSSTVRCWNYGRLVYEGSARGPVAAGQNTVFTVPSDQRSIQIVDLKAGFCIVD